MADPLGEDSKDQIKKIENGHAIYCQATVSLLDVDSKLAINAKLKSVETTWFTSGARQQDGNFVLLPTNENRVQYKDFNRGHFFLWAFAVVLVRRMTAATAAITLARLFRRDAVLCTVKASLQLCVQY